MYLAGRHCVLNVMTERWSFDPEGKFGLLRSKSQSLSIDMLLYIVS